MKKLSDGLLMIREIKRKAKEEEAIIRFEMDREIKMDNRLNKLEKRVLKMRMVKCLTLEEVGKKLGMTRERIRQIEARATVIADCF